MRTALATLAALAALQSAPALVADTPAPPTV